MSQDQAASLRSLSQSSVVPLRTARNRVIAVSGGKGGVGKSTLAVNLAVTYGSLGSKTLIMDGDLGMADLNLLFGRAPERSLLDVLRGTDLDDVVVPTHGVYLLPALNGSHQLANLDAGLREQLTAAIAGWASRFQTLVIDTAAGIQAANMELTDTADEVLVVATPEPLSLADAYACLKVLATRHGRKRAFICPNQVRSAEEAHTIVGQLTKLSNRFLGVELIALPAIPSDPGVSFAAAEGTPLVIARPDSPASRAMRRLARTLDALAICESNQRRSEVVR